nr:hypothetical protein [Tanacetum cinerariifolium]
KGRAAGRTAANGARHPRAPVPRSGVRRAARRGQRAPGGGRRRRQPSRPAGWRRGPRGAGLPRPRRQHLPDRWPQCHPARLRRRRPGHHPVRSDARPRGG